MRIINVYIVQRARMWARLLGWLVLAVLVLVSLQPGAAQGSPTVRVGSGTVLPGGSISVPLEVLNVTNLGAVTIEVHYDPSVITATACNADPNRVLDTALCNIGTAGVVQFTAVSTSGVSGNILLTQITFEAVGQPGICSNLTLDVQVLADTNGNPIPHGVENGQICIQALPTDTSTPPPPADTPTSVAPTDTPIPTSKPTEAITPTPCPAEVTLQGESAWSDLQTLRRFRDEVMAQSPAGQAYIKLYYQYSPELVRILLKDPDLQSRTARLLRELMPGIRNLLNESKGEKVVLTTARIKQIKDLLGDYAKRASPKLRVAIEQSSKPVKHLEGKTLEEAWKYISTSSSSE